MYREGILGDKVRELTLPTITLTEARFTPGGELPWHAHERARFCLVLDGTYMEEFRGAQYQLRPFDLTFKPDGAEHRHQYNAFGSAQCLVMEFDQRWIAALREKGPLVDTPSFFSSGAFPEAGRRIYDEFVAPDDVSGLAIETTCIDLLVHASRRARSNHGVQTPSWLLRIRDMLHADCREQFTLQELARIAAVHPVHLAQTFRRCYACTIGDYVRNLRVMRAADELAHTDKPIAAIAAALGFCDQSHLNRVFKRQMKVTPAQYRRAHGTAPAATSLHPGSTSTGKRKTA